MSLVATPSPVSALCHCIRSPPLPSLYLLFLSLYPASLHCLYLLLPFVIVSGSPPLYLSSLTFFIASFPPPPPLLLPSLTFWHCFRPSAPSPPLPPSSLTFCHCISPPPPPLPWLYLPLPFVIASVPRPLPSLSLSLTFCHCSPN